MRVFKALPGLASIIGCAAASGPFLQTVDSSSWVIGNDLWNITIGKYYGTKLYYKDNDLIGDAYGHYVDLPSTKVVLSWTSASIYKETDSYTDIVFTAGEYGELHWVLQSDLVGAYQYFIVNSFPELGVFRTLVRLDNTTFFSGHTGIKDDLLPTYSEILAGTKVQDETWETADGTYITKYDWVNWVREQDFYGVYGDEFGSWYINPSKEYFNGDHLKQELMVHRESSTGDVVQLNVMHGTHFMASSDDYVEQGRMFGPWLWYINNGSIADASTRAAQEITLWPYFFVNDTAYQSRGTITGTITLTDGTPASGASVFLGDNNPNETTLDQGRAYYYTTSASSTGTFTFTDVRTGTYALQAWGNGSPALSSITTTFLQNDVVVTANETTTLTNLTWTPQQGRTPIFQIGDLDRKATGFEYGDAPHQHALVDKCPANLTYTIGVSNTSDWCFGQSALGTWDVKFYINSTTNSSTSTAAALLSISLAGYSKGTSASIYLNNDTTSTIGNLTSGIIPTDPCLYRSATSAGEWHLYEFEIAEGVLKSGEWNVLSFVVTKSTTWKGWIWDSVVLEWV
ncbi:MAG: hypothetical protein M1834_008877 [Cirrosporium novae-zelandiae]|nr:MAG: hypothetical protein M1834_008877 [Cirrosporium novae-zelandiae]